MSRRTFVAWIAVAGAAVVAQSVAHLALAMTADRPRTAFDVERSNGIPDLVSSAVMALASVAALAIARAERAPQRVVALLAATVLAGLTAADLLHDGPRPSSTGGELVLGLVAVAAVLVGLIALRGARRSRVTLTVAAVLLVGSSLASGLDRFEAFEGRRGELGKEGRLVAKEGLELLGWSLVTLALWDEALRRRAPGETVRAPASPAQAARTRRVA